MVSAFTKEVKIDKKKTGQLNLWNHFLKSEAQNVMIENWLNTYFGLVAGVDP